MIWEHVMQSDFLKSESCVRVSVRVIVSGQSSISRTHKQEFNVTRGHRRCRTV